MDKIKEKLNAWLDAEVRVCKKMGCKNKDIKKCLHYTNLKLIPYDKINKRAYIKKIKECKFITLSGGSYIVSTEELK